MQTLQPKTLLQGGRYKIIKTLGQGSFGITYLAVHTGLNRKVAIKEFFMRELNSRSEDGSITGMSDGSLSQNYCQKFQKEAINLCHLDHPNIVRVTDSFSENGTYYYVMDYIDGQNLDDYIKQHHVSESEAVEIIKSVADALIYIHENHHMLHLDLKPGNVMRRESDGRIFLIDFGLSKHYSNDGQPETSTTIGLGSAGYAPVEQGNKTKDGEFRPTIDVYALAATFYKLLTCETPPPASDLVSDDELIENNLRVKGVSDNLIKIVVEAMCPNVRKRTQTIRDFKIDLEGIKVEANPTSNVISNEIIGSDKDETIVTSANNSNNSSEAVEGKTLVGPKTASGMSDFTEQPQLEEPVVTETMEVESRKTDYAVEKDIVFGLAAIFFILAVIGELVSCAHEEGNLGILGKLPPWVDCATSVLGECGLFILLYAMLKPASINCGPSVSGIALGCAFLNVFSLVVTDESDVMIGCFSLPVAVVWMVCLTVFGIKAIKNKEICDFKNEETNYLKYTGILCLVVVAFFIISSFIEGTKAFIEGYREAETGMDKTNLKDPIMFSTICYAVDIISYFVDIVQAYVMTKCTIQLSNHRYEITHNKTR